MKVIQKTLNPSVVEYERKAFFRAALKLVEAGKFQFASMDEIAFHARISSMAIPFIFASKEDLFSALVDDVVIQIDHVVAAVDKVPGSFKGKFFETWLRLYEYYTKYPGVISLIEQMENEGQAGLNSGIIKTLSEFLRTGQDELSHYINVDAMASVFHENVLTAAKMKSVDVPELENLRLKLLPLLLWEAFADCQNNKLGALYQ